MAQKKAVKYVENEYVNPDRPWKKSGWLQTVAKNGKKSTFIFASHVYETPDGEEVTVFFNHETAFLLILEEGTMDEELLTAKDLINIFRQGRPSGFPDDLEEYMAIIPAGETECDEEILSRFDIDDAKEDIEQRLNDLRPYGEVTYENVPGVKLTGDEVNYG